MEHKRFYNKEDILKGLINHDRNVIIYLYTDIYPMIEKLLIKEYNATIEDARDIFQNALLSLYTYLLTKPSLKIEQTIFTFFYMFSKRRMIDKIRIKIKQRKLADKTAVYEETEPEIIEILMKEERMKLYSKHFGKLGEKCQVLLQLVFEGQTIKKITEILEFKSERFTQRQRLICKESLFRKIYSDPIFKELNYETSFDIRKLPKW